MRYIADLKNDALGKAENSKFGLEISHIVLTLFPFPSHSSVGICGLVDKCWVHKQKLVGSSPVAVNLLLLTQVWVPAMLGR